MINYYNYLTKTTLSTLLLFIYRGEIVYGTQRAWQQTAQSAFDNNALYEYFFFLLKSAYK